MRVRSTFATLKDRATANIELEKSSYYMDRNLNCSKKNATEMDGSVKERPKRPKRPRKT